MKIQVTVTEDIKGRMDGEGAERSKTGPHRLGAEDFCIGQHGNRPASLRTHSSHTEES